MGAFVDFGDIKGESLDAEHKEWVLVESVTAPIHRSIAPGAKGIERSRGSTSVGDVVIVRKMDKSSVELWEACAKGKYFPKVVIDFSTTKDGKSQSYLKKTLTDVIVSSYSFFGSSSGDPVPNEEVTLNFAKEEIVYVIRDNQKGDEKGTVNGSYDPEVDG